MLAGMFGGPRIGAIATAAPLGAQRAAGIRGEIVVALVIVVGVFVYTWVASRLVKMPNAALGAPGVRRGTDRAGSSEPEPLVDGLLRDLDVALRDRGMVREARRRVLLSRRSRPTGPAGSGGSPGPSH
jgi:hypothetical protein